MPKIVARLREFEAQMGEEFKPAALLESLAREEKNFAYQGK